MRTTLGPWLGVLLLVGACGTPAPTPPAASPTAVSTPAAVVADTGSPAPPPASPAATTGAATSPGQAVSGSLGAVDPKARTVTVGGGTYTYGDPQFFDGYKPGDPVRIHVQGNEVLSVEPKGDPPPGADIPTGAEAMDLIGVVKRVDHTHKTVTFGAPGAADVAAGNQVRFTFRDPALVQELKEGDMVEFEVEGGIITGVKRQTSDDEDAGPRSGQ